MIIHALNMRGNTQRRTFTLALLWMVGVFLVGLGDAFLLGYDNARRSAVTTTIGVTDRSRRKHASLLLIRTAAPASIEDRASARSLVFQGMETFRRGDVAGSIQYFDQAERAQGASLTPFLWQRGLSYYYANDFALASEQFRTDVQVNPSDVEEIVWDIAAQLRMMDPAAQIFPVPSQMTLPPGTRDRRRIMVRGL